MRLNSHQSFSCRIISQSVLLMFLMIVVAIAACLTGCMHPDANDNIQQVSDIPSGEISVSGDNNAAVQHSAETNSKTKRSDGTDDAAEDIFKGTWLLKMYEAQVNGDVYTYSHEQVESYQQATEVACGLEFYEDNVCGLSLIGYSHYTNWTQEDAIDATINIVFGRQLANGNYNAVKVPMTYDANEETIEFFADFPTAYDKGNLSIKSMHCVFIRGTNPEKSLADYSQELEDANEAFYKSLSIDDALDNRVLVNDATCQIRLMGTTHDDTAETVGYLLQAVNKTDTPLLVNHFLNPVFTVNGHPVSASYIRLLPNKVVAEDTKEEMFKPVLMYLSFPKADIGEMLSNASGKLAVTDLNWEVHGSYDINI